MYLSEIVGKGNIRARVVTHSILEGYEDTPLVTYELRYPRYIHAEFLTHRVFSRNASSSRAIPVRIMLEQVEKDPAMPIHWGINKPGMQASEEWDFEDGGEWNPQWEWRQSAKTSAAHAKMLSTQGLHKQVSNRILEPFQFINVVVTSTEWDNFFLLRDHKDAQPEIRELAQVMRIAMIESKPTILKSGQWHLPYITQEELNDCMEQSPREDWLYDNLIKSSAARCARVSYMKHDKSNPSIEDDLELFNMLAVRPYDNGNGHVLGEFDPVHLSPLEHQAESCDITKVTTMDMPWPVGYTHMDKNHSLWSGNFRSPWIQYRQIFGENNES